MEFYPGESKEEGEDTSLEWLSIFIEDCHSSSTSFTSQPLSTLSNPTITPTTTPTTTQSHLQTPQKSKHSFHNHALIPSKARTKRRKNTQKHTHLHVDPPLLHQTHWLAESELITLPSQKDQEAVVKPLVEGKELGQMRRCTHCLTQRTPQWRAGPMGPKTLCNACGVRFKSGRLLPEYRPARSPTFVSYKHSNSHKKVMEMRMALPSSPSSN